jgi:uncharacterized protein DUF2752
VIASDATEMTPIALRALRGGAPLGIVFLAVGVVSAVGVGLLHLDQASVGFCAFKAITGWPCLTCGTTRAFARLFALDLRGAFAMNPLATGVAFALVPWGIADLVLSLRGRALALDLSPWAGRVVRVLALALVALNWVYLIAAGR